MTGPRVCTCGATVLPVGVAVLVRPDGMHRPDPEGCEPSSDQDDDDQPWPRDAVRTVVGLIWSCALVLLILTIFLYIGRTRGAW